MTREIIGVFDLNIQLNGHKLSFYRALTEYVNQRKERAKMVHFLSNYSNEFNLNQENDCIKVSQIDDQVQKEILNSNGTLSRYKKEWKQIQNYATNHKINRVVLLDLDIYQQAIGGNKTSFLIEGIWFRPYGRIDLKLGTNLLGKSKHFIFLLRKKIQMSYALRNQNLEKVYILNDHELPKKLNRTPPRFFYLPDPIFDNPQKTDFDLRQHYNIKKGQMVLLLFGYIDGRKNPKNIILALNHLKDSEKISLLIVGKFESGLKTELEQLKKGDYQAIFRDEFITDEEMESTFAQSDLILRMNVNFYGSSGIVGIAAKYGKAVLVSPIGLVAEIVTQYQLGSLADPSNIQEIAKALQAYQNGELPLKVNGEKFVKNHSLSDFAHTLLSF